MPIKFQLSIAENELHVVEILLILIELNIGLINRRRVSDLVQLRIYHDFKGFNHNGCMLYTPLSQV